MYNARATNVGSGSPHALFENLAETGNLQFANLQRKPWTIGVGSACHPSTNLQIGKLQLSYLDNSIHNSLAAGFGSGCNLFGKVQIGKLHVRTLRFSSNLLESGCRQSTIQNLVIHVNQIHV